MADISLFVLVNSLFLLIITAIFLFKIFYRFIYVFKFILRKYVFIMIMNL